jgi:hypothetical protein
MMSKRDEGSEAGTGGGGEGAAAERFEVPERWSAAKVWA